MSDPRPTPAREAIDEPEERQSDERPLAVVDGSNVAYAGSPGKPKLASIRAMTRALRLEGYRPVVVVDAALRHAIDDPDGYEELVESGEIRQAPAGTDADYFILSFAGDLDASVVSNDRFGDHPNELEPVRDRLIRYMIVEGDVVFERRTRPR